MKTILHLWNNTVNKYSNNTFFLEKSDEIYKHYTFKDTDERVKSFACELLSMGAVYGDRIAIIAMGSRDWVVCEMGLLFAGCVSVPLSPKLDCSELKFRLEHSQTKVIIVGANQYSSMIKTIHSIKSIKKIIVLGNRASGIDEVNIEDFVTSGEAKYALEMYKNKLKIIESKVQENDLAILSYTSGTTADPKGVMLTHKNMYVNTEQSLGLYPVTEDDVMLLILPVDHSFAHTAGLYTIMSVGGTLASVDQGKSAQDFLKNIPVNIKETEPTILLSVPALAKTFRKNIENAIKSKGTVAQKLFSSGLNIAYKYIGDGWNKGKGIRALYKIPYLFYDRILFSKIRENFGGRLKCFVGGGALLDVELQRFFMAVGMPMYQGYGLSEAAPVISANTSEKVKFGSSGQLVKDLEIRIIDDNGNLLGAGEKGEICVRGENVMPGYYRNPESTSKAIKDSWLYTGDLGYMDNEGFLWVLGRCKSLLIGADGEKYSPEGIEDSLPATSRVIEQVMLYNDHKPYTVALIYPDVNAIKAEFEMKNINLSSEECISEAIELIRKDIMEYRSGGRYQHLFHSRWIPSKFAVLKEGFTEQNTFLNSSLKMVRSRITTHYKDLINYLYSEDCVNHHCEHNTNSMKELLRLN